MLEMDEDRVLWEVLWSLVGVVDELDLAPAFADPAVVLGEISLALCPEVRDDRFDA